MQPDISMPKPKVYIKYIALLSQIGTDPPTAIILENNIGEIVWTRAFEGEYYGTLTGAFPDVNKCYTNITQNLSNVSQIIAWNSVNDIYVGTTLNPSTPQDGSLNRTCIEIRIYT